MDMKEATVEVDSTEDVDAPGIPDAVKDAAARRQMDRPTADAALEWLLSDEDDGEVTKDVQINLAGGLGERWITWKLRSVDREILRSIQRTVTGNRAQRRGGGEADAGQANLRIVACATVEPDLVEAAKRRNIQEGPDPMFAPMQLLAWRFRGRPGLIDQLAGEVLNLSGYDEEDLRSGVMIEAAKN